MKGNKEMNYKIRMLDELLDLKEKITKAENCNITMTESENKLLNDQIVAMKRYYEILYKRLTDKLELKSSSFCNLVL